VLNRDPANIAVTVKVEQGILIKILSFGDLGRTKLNV